MKNRRIIRAVALAVFALAFLASCVVCFLWVFHGLPSVLASLLLLPLGIASVVALAVAELLKR